MVTSNRQSHLSPGIASDKPIFHPVEIPISTLGDVHFHRPRPTGITPSLATACGLCRLKNMPILGRCP